MATLFVKRLTETAMLPTVANSGDLGHDLFSDLAGASLTIPPKENAAISTGIAIEFFPMAGGLILTRSSMAKKRVIVVGGVIDSTYSGPLIIMLENLGTEPYTVQHGDKIGQLLFYPNLAGKVQETVEITTSQRGQAGFGSSGR